MHRGAILSIDVGNLGLIAAKQRGFFSDLQLVFTIPIKF